MDQAHTTGIAVSCIAAPTASGAVPYEVEARSARCAVLQLPSAIGCRGLAAHGGFRRGRRAVCGILRSCLGIAAVECFILSSTVNIHTITLHVLLQALPLRIDACKLNYFQSYSYNVKYYLEPYL